jgi:hypothetical protein
MRIWSTLSIPLKRWGRNSESLGNVVAGKNLQFSRHRILEFHVWPDSGKKASWSFKSELSPGLTGIPLWGLLGEFIRGDPYRVPPSWIAIRNLLDVRRPPFSNTRLCTRSWLIVTDSAWIGASACLTKTIIKFTRKNRFLWFLRVNQRPGIGGVGTRTGAVQAGCETCQGAGRSAGIHSSSHVMPRCCRSVK